MTQHFHDCKNIGIMDLSLNIPREANYRRFIHLDGNIETKPTDEEIFKALIQELLGGDNIS